MTPAILALSGPTLTSDERALFRDANSAGYILFARNIEHRTQLRALTDDLRSLSGRDQLPILIDQEGGRVARLTQPEWPAFPAAARFDTLYEIAPATAIAAARANATAIALTLAEVGVTVNCLPLLDIRQPDAHAIIGDRALGSDPLRVAALGRAVLAGLRDGGVCGVIKHMPGHGRATADSHAELPVVGATDAELARDIAPFAALADAPMGMTAHVVYPVWDADRPATLSPTIIADIIRTRIGFDGLLMTDDIGMHALSGPVATRGTDALAAGCDVVLHCSGDLTDMAVLVDAIGGSMTDAASARLARAMERVGPPRTGESLAALTARRDAYLALA